MKVEFEDKPLKGKRFEREQVISFARNSYNIALKKRGRDHHRRYGNYPAPFMDGSSPAEKAYVEATAALLRALGATIAR